MLDFSIIIWLSTNVSFVNHLPGDRQCRPKHVGGVSCIYKTDFILFYFILFYFILYYIILFYFICLFIYCCCAVVVTNTVNRYTWRNMDDLKPGLQIFLMKHLQRARHSTVCYVQSITSNGSCDRPGRYRPWLSIKAASVRNALRIEPLTKVFLRPLKSTL